MESDPNLVIARQPVTWMVAALWLTSCAIVIVPGGVVDQVRLAEQRVKANQADSPFGRTCYRCDRPAISWADYDDGSRRYFCDLHPPPAEMVRTESGDQGPPAFNPTFCFGVLALIYVTGSVRAFIHLISGGRRFKPTVPGGVAGITAALLLWVWFSSVGS